MVTRAARSLSTVELHHCGQLAQPGQTTEEGAVMTIQDFNEALKEQGSSYYRAFAELRQARVREVLDDPAAAGDAGPWMPWG